MKEKYLAKLLPMIQLLAPEVFKQVDDAPVKEYIDRCEPLDGLTHDIYTECIIRRDLHSSVQETM